MPTFNVAHPCSVPNCPDPGHYDDIETTCIDVQSMKVQHTLLGHYCRYHYTTLPRQRPYALQAAVDWMKADPAFLDEVISKRRELDRQVKGK
jgi:hypothetical protein